MKTGKKLMILLCVILALACLCGTASAASPAESGAAGTARLLHLEISLPFCSTFQ